MQRSAKITLFMGGLLVLATVISCTGTKPDSVGEDQQRLSACPDSPNCVSSDATDKEHGIKPFRLKGDFETNWPRVIESVESLPRTSVVTKTGSYLHAACKSLIFRFTDDLELRLDRATGIIAVRSASRLGHSDLGVNRKRVESLRSSLQNNGIIEP
ncbi:MAG: DUF1499 domain-containing protein [bacterium]